MSAVDTYRGQQGLTGKVASSGYDPDPQVVDWIKQASAATGADPYVLLATALQESGGKLHGPAGDGGTSFGTFQFHIGGALGNHPPAWASTYPAFLNRAQQFARLKVRGGTGAAAVQGPKDKYLYARGVDSLLGVAHQILEGYQGAPSTTTRSPLGRAPGSDPGSPAIKFHALSGPEAALRIMNAKGAGAARIEFNNAEKVYTLPATPPRTGFTAAPLQPPAAISGVGLSPGGGWGGSYAPATALAKLGESMGLSIASEKRDRMMTTSGNVSDHYIGNKTAYAYDMSNGSAPTPQMDKFATTVAAQLGVPDWHGGVLNVDRGGYRYQVLYRTHVGGNHFNHVHIGVKKL